MSMLLRGLSRLRHGRSALVRSSLMNLSNGFSSSLRQTPPCLHSCIDEHGKLVIMNFNDRELAYLEKKVPLELMDKDAMITIGASHGWVATLKEDGILRLQDDLNPYASDKDPKRIPLPPLVTLPHCQTQIVTNVSMSTSSPEDEDCVVAVKFLGSQLSFCRPAQSNPQWINTRIAHPCFYSSLVMFSKTHDMFRIPGSGGQVIGSWDLGDYLHKPKFDKLRFRKLPELTNSQQQLEDSCCTIERMVESTTTGETFLIKLYRKATATASGKVKLKTKTAKVFKLDDKGNAVYTEDIGDLCIFLSMSESFCVPASSFPGLYSNHVEFVDAEEIGAVLLDHPVSIISLHGQNAAPYFIPPQNIE